MRVAASALALVLCACGALTALDDGGTDAMPGMQDAGSDALVDALDSGSDAGAIDEFKSDVPAIHSKCAESEDCDASDAVCCTTLKFDTSNGRCLFSSLSGACAPLSTCPTSFQPFCGGDEVVHQCDQNANCVEPDYPVCCTFWFDTTWGPGQEGLTICTSQAAANAADASCVP
jgi:hypothetical protein